VSEPLQTPGSGLGNGWRTVVLTGGDLLERALADSTTVAWDFDGVVASTEPFHARSYEQMLEQMGVVDFSLDFDRFVGNPELSIWGAIADETGLHIDPVEARTERLQLYLSAVEGVLEPYGFVRPLMTHIVDGLGGRNIIISSQERSIIERLLERWGLSGLIDDVRSGADPAVASKEDLIRAFSDEQPGGVIIEDSVAAAEFSDRLGLTVVIVEQPYNVAALERAAAVIQPEAP
jgi:beta-phosphoglucomutase-like phosphatase (HAD superfamily)